MTSFSAQVDDWVRQTRERTEAVFKESAQRLLVNTNKDVPIDTGFARASLLAQINAPVTTVTFRPSNAQSGQFSNTPSNVSVSIAGAELGDTIYATWTANYVGFLNSGARGRPALMFLEKNAQQWPQIVNRVASELRRRNR